MGGGAGMGTALTLWINKAYIIAVITLLIFPRGPSDCSTEIRRKYLFSSEVLFFPA